MARFHDQEDIYDNIKGLTTLYCLLEYARRELATLCASGEGADEGLERVQTIIRDHIASAEAVIALGGADDDPAILQ